MAETLAFLETKWLELFPGRPFNYFFLDTDFGKLFRAEERLQKILGYFTLLAIFIACLGLFGLTSFMILQRTKEIGIRKVLGATISNVVLLLSKDFLILVGIAFIGAMPIAYVAMSRWLQDFAYRIEIGMGIFFGAGALAIFIALITISYQAVRAALVNPANSIRYE
jgi:putative ABC transport system permease protein